MTSDAERLAKHTGDLDDDGHDIVAASGGVSDITDFPTAESDTTKRLAPDGAGGVEWGTGGGGGGVTDHGALTGLTDDDHTQYATNVDLTAHAGTPHGGGSSDHGALTGLGDDDHPQYASDADLTTHAATSHGVTAHSALSGLAADDHPQYATDTDLTTHAGTSHGVTAHGSLSGLTNDDHPQYATDTDLTTHAATPHGGGGATTLDGLTDVDTSTVPPTNGQVLAYETASSLWKPGAVGSLLSTVSSARVETGENRNSTAWGDLTTAGPAVTVVVPASGKVRVSLGCACFVAAGSSHSGIMGFELSGANTRTPQDGTALYMPFPPSGSLEGNTKTTVLTGLTPGLTTFTAKYRVANAAVTMSFNYREIIVEPLDVPGTAPVGLNLIQNGRFRINQRGYASGTALASAAYGIDRWKATTASTSLTWVTVPQGQPVTISSGGSIAQIVERQEVNAGAYVLSWEGTATGRVYNVGGSAPAYAVSPVLVNLDGLANVTVEFTAAGGTKTLEKVKLELGSTPTAYSQLPIDQELMACKRFYQTVTQWDGIGDSAAAIGMSHAFNPPMRAAPTLAKFPGAQLNFRNNGGDTLIAAATWNIANNAQSVYGFWTQFTGVTAVLNRPYNSRFGVNSGPILEMSAEL